MFRTRSSWLALLSRWFPRSRPAARRGLARLGLEALEDRLTPTLSLTYGGAGSVLSLVEQGSAFGPGNDTVIISEPTAGTLHIDLGKAVFDPSSSTQGVNYSFGPSGAASSADISIAKPGAIRLLFIDLGGGSDSLALGLTNAANAVGGIQVVESGQGIDAITLNSLALTGNLYVSGGPITVAPGATVATHGGSLTLLGNGVAAINGGTGIEIAGATLDSGANGNLRMTGIAATASGGLTGLSVTGGPGNQAPASIGAHGIDIRNGAALQAEGAGSVTLNGTGGTGTGADSNAGVFIFGANTAVTTSSGDISIHGVGQGTGRANDGIDVESGAVVGAGGNLTLNGSAGSGTDQNLGVFVDGSNTAVSAGGNLSITGSGQGSGNQDYGIDVEGAALVSAANSGSLTLQGQTPGDTAAITFNGLAHGSGALRSGSGAVTLTGDVIDLGAANSISTGNGSQLFLAPLTANRPIDLGNVSDKPGALTFTTADAAAIAQGGANGFRQITIGRSDGTGLISTAASLSFNTALVLQSSGANSQGLNISNSVDVGAANNLSLLGGPVLVSGASTQLLAHGGTLTVAGSGTATIDFGVGVDVNNGATLDGGTVSVSGSGAAGTVESFGVSISKSNLQSEGSGLLTLKGSGGNGAGTDGGVFMFEPLLQTQGGNLSITGTGSGTGQGSGAFNVFNSGIDIARGTIEAGGAGTLSLNGTAGYGTELNDGVTIDSTKVTTEGGNLSITGTGRGSENGNEGIRIDEGLIQAGGAGTLTLNGTGGNGTYENVGVIINGTNMTTAGGNLSIIGTGQGSGVANDGIEVNLGTTVSVGGGGSLTLQGQAPGDTPAITFNGFQGGSGALQSGSGDVTLIGDVIDLGDASSITTTGGSQLFFQPLSPSRAIDLGNASDQPSALTFTPGDNTAIVQGANGFRQLTIGRSDGTGLLGTAASLAFNTALTLQSAGANSQGVNISSSIDVGTGHNLSVLGGPVLVSGASTQVLTHGGTLTVSGSSTGVRQDIGVNIDGATLDGGIVSVSGSGAAGTSGADGVYIHNGSKVQSEGSGSLTLSGTGGNGFSDNSGVFLDRAGTTVATEGGNLSITGTGQGSHDHNYGIYVFRGVLIHAGGNGNLSLQGSGGNGTDANYGVGMFGTGTTVQTLGGNLYITGTGHGSGTINYGITIDGGALVEAGGNGTLTLNGTGGNGRDNNVGVQGRGSVTTAGGNLSITGTGHGSGSGNHGIDVASGVQAGGNGTLTLNGTGGNGTDSNVGVQVTSGVTTAGGNLSITGTGHGSGSGNHGIDVASGVQAGGNGTLTLNGTGGNGTDSNVGVQVTSGVTTAGGNLSITGTGHGNGQINYGISIGGAVVQAGGNGTLSLQGTSGNGTDSNVGVTINSTKVRTGGGNLSVTGTGQGSGTINYGISIDGGLMQAGGAGTLTLNGTGGNGTDSDAGVLLVGSGSQVTTAGGNLCVTGTGQGSGTGNDGIKVATGALVQAGGAGTLSLKGTGGNGLDDNYGVYLTDVHTAVKAIAGNLSITGVGQGSGTVNQGIVVNDAVIQAGGKGAVTLNGTGGNGLSENHGVRLSGASTAVMTADGNLSITGVGQGSSGANDGLDVFQGVVIHAGGSGAVTLNGNGGNGTNQNLGIWLDGLDTAMTTVTTAGGNLSITGVGQGSDAGDGLVIGDTNVVIHAGGSGAVTLNGTGGSGTFGGQGVEVSGNTVVTTEGGSVSIIGAGGHGTTGSDSGIELTRGATVRAGGNGTVTLRGQAPGDTSAITFNDAFNDGTGFLQSGSGDVTLIGDVIDLGSANSITTTGGSRLFFQPFTAGRPLDLGNANDQAGALTFTPRDLAAIALAANGFRQITLGRSDGTGLVSTAASLTFNTSVTLQASGPGSQGVKIANTIDVGTGHNLSVLGGPVVVSGASTQLLTRGGTLTVSGTGTATVDGGIGIDVSGATLDGGTNGVVSVSGNGAAGTSNAYGISIHGGASVRSEGSGTLTLNGTGGNGLNQNAGVSIADSGTKVTTANGNLSIAGAGQGSGQFNYGILVQAGALAQGNGGGNLSLTGTGGNGTNADAGVFIKDPGTMVTTTAQDNLSIKGCGQGSGTQDYGIDVEAGALIGAVKFGTTTLQGQAPGDTPAITFNGFGSGSGLLQAGFGDVTLIGDVIDLGSANSITTTGGSRLFFQPYTAGRPIDLGNASDQPGVLTFTAADNAASAQGATGFRQITIGRSDGTGLVGTAATLTFNAALTLRSAGANSQGVQIGNSIDVGGHALALLGGPVVVRGAATELLTHGGDLSITGVGNAGVNNGTGTDIDGATLDSFPGGNVSVTGTAATIGGIGVLIFNGANVLSAGNGTLTLTGAGGNGTDSNQGVRIAGANTTVATEGGNLSITGTGQGSGAGNDGISIGLGALVQASGTGRLTLNGTGGNGTDGNIGVFIAGTGTLVQTLGGKLTLNGVGQGSGIGNDGILVNGAVAQAGGTAAVILNGSGPARTGNAGVRITGSGRITAGGAGATESLGLNSTSLLIASLGPLDTTASGYEFVHVDGAVFLAAGKLQATVVGTVLPGKSFTLINSPTAPIFALFTVNSFTIGSARYSISYSNSNTQAILKRIA